MKRMHFTLLSSLAIAALAAASPAGDRSPLVVRRPFLVDLLGRRQVSHLWSAETFIWPAKCSAKPSRLTAGLSPPPP